jgi:ABC-type thiamine transport system substrate-binding protein
MADVLLGVTNDKTHVKKTTNLFQNTHCLWGSQGLETAWIQRKNGYDAGFNQHVHVGEGTQPLNKSLGIIVIMLCVVCSSLFTTFLR